MSHDWILANIPVDKGLLRQWLKCGYFEKHEFFPTKAGVPQGSPIAPTIANMVLDGLEKVIKAALPRKTKVNFVRFADDFIVSGETREMLEREDLPVIDRFLEPRGLRLSRAKIQITYIEDGFDFLGKNFRKYGGKLLIQPSKKSIESITVKIRDTVGKHRGQAAAVLIQALNPMIRGWAEAQETVQAATA
jgi:RNA-directed DNA polymerase